MNRFPVSRRLVIAGLASALATVSAAPLLAQPADREAAYDVLLKTYVVVNPDGVNRIDYAKWHANAADRRTLDAYVKELETRKPSAMPRDEAFAYWGNLYNALTLKLVLDKYPIETVRDIKSEGGLGAWFDVKAYTGPWRQQRSMVEGEKLSLDDIEHKKMRPVFKDPRVHYVVNCASWGCPNLKTTAWRAATLEADLEAAARDFINHRRGVQQLPNGSLKVSSIYKWFIEDFGGDDAGVLAHLRKYAGPELAQRLTGSPKIAEDDYVWTLNGSDRGGPKS
ncbi:MAG: DUF547 domain-containing protein [Beijerinckiaceae bacterium]